MMSTHERPHVQLMCLDNGSAAIIDDESIYRLREPDGDVCVTVQTSAATPIPSQSTSQIRESHHSGACCSENFESMAGPSRTVG